MRMDNGGFQKSREHIWTTVELKEVTPQSNKSKDDYPPPDASQTNGGPCKGKQCKPLRPSPWHPLKSVFLIILLVCFLLWLGISFFVKTTES